MPTCGCCATTFPNRMNIAGRVRVLNKRRFCLSCSPFGNHNTSVSPLDAKTRACEVCGCRVQRRKLCCSCYTKLRRYRMKLKAVAYKGGCCKRCGWSGHIAAFEFHHRDPSKKSFAIGSGASNSWRKVKAELDKCDMLCANCHQTEHAEAYDQLTQFLMVGVAERLRHLAVNQDQTGSTPVAHPHAGL